MTTTLSIVNTSGSLNFDSIAKYDCESTSYAINSQNSYTLTSNTDLYMETYNGNLGIRSAKGAITINSSGNLSNAVVIQASNTNGGILQTAGKGGFNVITSNGDINLLSKGSNVNIGVSPIGTSPIYQTQNITLESYDNFNVSSRDMYFVSSEVMSFVSTTGDIEFGTSSNGTPIFKFQNGNIIVNQASSDLDYQLDVAVSHSSNNTTKTGYNGIMVNTVNANVAADITLQSSNTASTDGTQCIMSIGSFGSNNKQAYFQRYLAYQTGNVVIRLDGPAYSPNSINTGFGHDFTYADIGRDIFWTTTNRLDTITELGVYVSPTSDTANVSVSGTYTGNTSRIYLLQIDSISTPNTFMWSNNGGVSFQNIYVPILNTPIALDSNVSVTFAATTGFYYNQQFTFQTKITAIVTNANSIPIPETMYSLQPFHSYIQTITPSDIVIKTNSNERMRITGDGSISIQKEIPTASFDLNSDYNKVILVNDSLAGYQINPSITYIESGGYVIVWNSQDISGPVYNFNIFGQRYLTDGSRYGNNFQINTISTLNQSFPSIACNHLYDSNHFIVTWASNSTIGNLYNVYCQIFHNSIAIKITDILIDTSVISTTNQLYPRCAGLYNGNYIITWAASDTGSGGIYSIYGVIIDDSGNTVRTKFQISAPNVYSNNYPYVAALPSTDIYFPNGFVVGYMTATDNTASPRYTISLRVYNYNATVSSAEIPITSQGANTYSSISDGLLSVAEIYKHDIDTNANANTSNSFGNFILSFYRNYLADTTLYNVGDNVTGLLSGSTATIQARYPSQRIITLQNISNRFLVAEEINIVSSVPNVTNVVEKISAITFLTTSTANITLDTGSKDVMAYCFASNIASESDAIWSTQVNTSLLYSDADRTTGNASIFVYKKPLAAVTVDNDGTAMFTWSNGTIPSVYYQLINSSTGAFIGTEERLTSQYDGLKQRDQVVTHLQSIQNNDYGFVISWDNQSLDLQDTGIYQQLIGYNHYIFNLEDGNSNLVFNHNNQLGIGTTSPLSTLHMVTPLSSSFGDIANPCTLTLQNTSKHIITNQALQSIEFIDGDSNILNKIQSINSLRYDDLYPQPTNLIGFYKFDQTEGTQVVDSSGSSTFLDVSNVPVYINTNGILLNFDIENCWVPGIINNALLFDGYDDYVFVENTALNGLNTVLETDNSQLSISVWVNIPNNIVNGSVYDIVCNGGNVSLSGTYLLSLRDLTSNGTMVVTSNIIVNNGISTYPGTNIGVNGTTKINDSNWHHIVETVDLSSTSNCVTKIYVDGVLEVSNTQSGIVNQITHGSYKTFFGSRDGTSNFFRGYMDELRFYNSIITQSQVTQLYDYGNPNSLPKGSIVFSTTFQNTTQTTSQNTQSISNNSIVIDNNGNINNLTSRPLPYSILSGELIAFQSNVTIFGIGTNFTNELSIGDIIVLGITQNINRVREFTVISITNNTLATIDKRAYTGPHTSISYQSVLRLPSIYTFFDNSDSILGHINNYGNMMLGGAKPSTMLEINNSNIQNTGNLPQITITNGDVDNTENGRLTALNFRGYDATNLLNPPITLASINTSHNGVLTDNKGIMQLSVNNGTALSTMMSLTSSGYIGINGGPNSGTTGQNNPLTLIHATTQSSNAECEILLQSNSNSNVISGYSVFDERSDLYFCGLTSITESTNPNIKYRVLSAVSGSNNSNTKTLNGRLDLLTNNYSTSVKNGIESRMSITHVGNVGVSILQPPNIFTVAPEKRITSGQNNIILSTLSGGTLVTLSNNVFSGSSDDNAMFVGGSIVIENDTLLRANILSVNAQNQITVDQNLSAYVNYTIHLHYPGLNVSGTNGCTGVNTTSPSSVLSVNGSLSLPITVVTNNITVNLLNHTVICNTASNTITVTLPVNSSSLNGRIYIIKKIGANTCSINPNGSNIDNVGGLYTVTTFVRIQSDGSNWWVIG